LFFFFRPSSRELRRSKGDASLTQELERGMRERGAATCQVNNSNTASARHTAYS